MKIREEKMYEEFMTERGKTQHPLMQVLGGNRGELEPPAPPPPAPAASFLQTLGIVTKICATCRLEEQHHMMSALQTWEKEVRQVLL